MRSQPLAIARTAMHCFLEGQAKVIGEKILEKKRNREFQLSRSDRFRYGITNAHNLAVEGTAIMLLFSSRASDYTNPGKLLNYPECPRL